MFFGKFFASKISFEYLRFSYFNLHYIRILRNIITNKFFKKKGKTDINEKNNFINIDIFFNCLYN